VPFLLDSTLAEIVDQGYEPRLVAHPILAVERDGEGGLVRLLGEATAASPSQASRESLIHIHLDFIDDAAARERLLESLRKTYEDVGVAVMDWPQMRARIDEAIASYRSNQLPLPADEVAEAVAFLEWIAADNFTFLGVRAYRFPAGDVAADPVEGSGLGILRKPEVKVLRRGRELVVMNQEVRAFLRRPRALIIAKANVKSRVHRRVHLDYVGVKLFAPDGGLEGELRIIGLFTSSAYTRSTAAVPYLRHKVARVVARAGFDPASHAGRALLNVLESYPRDELFQVDEETLYRFALDIMGLSERPTLRALARPDEFDRFVSVLVFIPKDRYDTNVRRRVGEFLAGVYAGASRPPTRPIPRARSPRTHYIIGRDEGATPTVTRETLEAGIAAIVRTWATPCATRSSRHRRPAARALAARYASAFSAPIARPSTPARPSTTSPPGAPLGRAPRASTSTARGRSRDAREPEGLLARRGPAALRARAAPGEPRLRVVNERTYRRPRGRTSGSGSTT
jgi:glutamate dehydrogenase